MKENFIIDAQGTTDRALRIARKLDLSRVTKVTATITNGKYSGGAANCALEFFDGDTVTIINGFGMGYGGTGPWGLYELLTMNLDIKKEDAEQLFIPWTHYKVWIVSK